MVTKPGRTEYGDVRIKRMDHRRAPSPAASVAPPQNETVDVGNLSIDNHSVKTLAKHVATQLGERAFCLVFENDLERCWPRKEMTRPKREREIQRFAESQGWTAAIVEGFGMRAIFRKLESASAF
jgi:hypothetical protein